MRRVPGDYDAILFDLLTALIDSPALWNRVAGNAEDGARWRAAYLRLTYSAGAYRPYESLVAQAAAAAGLPRSLADDLAAGYDGLEPWPEAPSVLGALNERVALGIVTNCSERLGRVAAARVGVDFAVIVTAESAGFYKPHPRPYQTALAAIGVAAGRCLFVAGSAYDLFGTAGLGLPTYWHNRLGMAAAPGVAAPVRHERSLAPLLDLFGLRGRSL
jgi:2-haloacid dehalogenase